MLFNIYFMPKETLESFLNKFPKHFPFINRKASLAQARCPWIPNTAIISHIDGKQGLTMAKLTLPTLGYSCHTTSPRLSPPTPSSSVVVRTGKRADLMCLPGMLLINTLVIPRCSHTLCKIISYVPFETTP